MSDLDGKIRRLEAHVSELEAAVDRVRRLHSQDNDLGLADGAWCPGCGEEEPCPTIRALYGWQQRKGFLS